MKRIASGSQSASAPSSYGADSGTPGYFVDASTSPSGSPTQLTPKWCNMVQEAVIQTIEGSGAVLADDLGQFADTVVGVHGITSHATDTTSATNPKTRVVIGSTTSRSSGSESACIASTDGLASGLSSAVIACAATCTASGASAAVIASGAGLASGLISAVIASVNSGGTPPTASGGKSANIACTGGVASGANSALIAAVDGTASAARAVVLGGDTGVASDINAACVGGVNNTASGENSAVHGGNGNTASGDEAGCLGGALNLASGEASAVVGGNGNAAATLYSATLACQGTSTAGGGNTEAAIACIDSVIYGSGQGRVMLASKNAVFNASANTSGQSSHIVGGGYSASSLSGSETANTNMTWSIRSQDGEFTAAGSFTGSADLNADFAEMFPNLETAVIPAGVLLANTGRRVRVAVPGDRVFGAVSAAPLVLGGTGGLGWVGEHLRDEFGAQLWRDVECVRFKGFDGPLEELGEVEIPADAERYTARDRVRNPAYDPTRPYKSRTDRRDEYTPVALLGQVRVRVSAGVQEGDMLAPGVGGVAVATDQPRGRPVEVLEITSPYDAARGYAVAHCLVG